MPNIQNIIKLCTPYPIPKYYYDKSTLKDILVYWLYILHRWCYTGLDIIYMWLTDMVTVARGQIESHCTR